MNTNGQLVHELNCSQQVAKEALEYLFKAFLWFFEKYKILDTLLVSPFVLHDSPEESQQKINTIRASTNELASTPSNFSALQKRQQIRQEDTEIQEKIMAFIFAAAPLDEKLAIDVLTEQKLHRPEENIKA